MLFLVKSVFLLLGLSGIGGFVYYLHSSLNPYPIYVKHIYKAEKNLGNCKFGLVNSFQDKNGGYPYQAVGSPLDREDNNVHKLELVVKSIKDSTEIQNACKNRPGQIVELSGTGSEWEFKGQTGDKHDLPSS